MSAKGVLVFFHCGSNTGYAIGRLEKVFFEMAKRLTADSDRVHFSFTTLRGATLSPPEPGFRNIIAFDPANGKKESLQAIGRYIQENDIDVAFGFDQPVSRPAYSVMREAGVRLLVSYWGAPMSSINHGLKLLLKKLEVRLTRHKPDHFIFESRAMARLAISGRGIDSQRISVIPTGVDTEKFKPAPSANTYAYDLFTIPHSRKIIYYSGHMERRKGVRVIIEAANQLVTRRNRRDVHFLLLGNVDGEEKAFLPAYAGTETAGHITFGGYRYDVQEILRSCYAGAIAATGWDSFPMSALEIMSSGLPLVGSRLQGIAEQIEHGRNGFFIEPDNALDLADKIEILLDDSAIQQRLGAAARRRVLESFSVEKQLENLVATMTELYCSTSSSR